MCTLNYLAIDRNNGGITQKMDSPGGRTGFFPYFLEECMKKSFHKFYVGTVDKLKPARPTMVGIRRKFLGILYINLYLHLSLEIWASYHTSASTLSLIPASHLVHLFQRVMGERLSLVDYCPTISK